MLLRKASSLIELVIAIVVMSIAVMTLPLMLERTQTNDEFAVQQEAILATKTLIGDILTFPWDDNSLHVVGGVAVLDTNLTDPRYLRTGDENISRIGHVRRDGRRKFFPDTDANISASVIGGPNNNIVDIGDFDGQTSTVVRGAGADDAGALDYKFDLNMTTQVEYVNDVFNPPNVFNFQTAGARNFSTNIKMIEVTMQAANGSLSQFTLRAYSSNIGGSLILRRDYP